MGMLTGAELYRAVCNDIQDWKRLMLVMMNGGHGVEKIVSHLPMDEMKSFSGYQLAGAPETGAGRPVCAVQ